MDVVRTKSKARRSLRWTAIVLVVVTVLVGVTAGMSLLEPALPTFDQSTVTLDTVQRGTLVREVQGSGTLVPVDVTWVSAEVGGQVLEVLVEPGIEVTPETELLKLRDPQLERAVREAERAVTSAQAEIERLELLQESNRLDLKVAIANAKANFEEAREQAEMDEAMARRGLKSPRQWRFSVDKAERNRMLFEVQVERATNSVKTQEIQYQERTAALAQANDRLEESREQLAALVVKAGTHGVLQQLGPSGGGLEEGQRVAQNSTVALISNPKELKAVLLVSQVQAQDVVVGQLASIDTRSGIVEGQVLRIDPGVQNDRVAVEVELTGELPKGARPDLRVEGLIQVARLDNVLHVRKPVYSQAGKRSEVFLLHADGQTASRTTVEFGTATVYSIQVATGLKEGDQIVVSDTTRWKDFEEVKLK